MSKKKHGLVMRFAVGDQDGVRSALWRVWKDSRKDDIYIAPSGQTPDGNIASIAKISLHKSRKCSFGFTSQYQRKTASSNLDRSVISWARRRGPKDGFCTAVSILIANTFLSNQASAYGDNLYLIDAPKENGAVVIDIMFTRVPLIQLLLSPNQVELCRLTLSNGETCVIIGGCCDDFDETLFLKSVLPLHEKTENLGRWKQPGNSSVDQLRGAVVALDNITDTLRIIDVGHNFAQT